MKYKISISDTQLKRKIERIAQQCAYGFTHFCDGKVNKSVAEEGTKAHRPCPHKHECELRKFSIITDRRQERR